MRLIQCPASPSRRTFLKKTIVLILSLSLFASSSFGYYEDHNNKKLLYGLVLSAAGLVLAFHGFSLAKEDISKPSLDSSQFSFSEDLYLPHTYPNPWYADATGQVTNTGNVHLKGYTICLNYYDAANNIVNEAKFQYYEGALNTGDSKPCTINTTACYNQPVRLEVTTTELQYAAIYKTRQNNQTEGIVGALIFGVGAYLMIDYALNINKFDTYMQKHDMDVRLAASRQSIGFVVSKRM